ncbi:hypothetical protein M422DRAFT_28284 [Sphaerobolus stellatus SS14]|nr:hypothetical protein M422DRAFT_28284 [Sphaerobolus stellatus SS14]
MPGGRPRIYFTPEEARQGHLKSKKAYRERNIDEERRKSRKRTRRALKRTKKEDAIAARAYMNDTLSEPISARLMQDVIMSKDGGEPSGIGPQWSKMSCRCELEPLLTEVWSTGLGISEPHSWQSYLETKHEQLVKVFQEKGLDAVTALAEPLLQQISHCLERNAEIFQEISRRRDKTYGKAHEKYKKLFMDSTRQGINLRALDMLVDLFVLYVRDDLMGLNMYLKDHKAKQHPWQ